MQGIIDIKGKPYTLVSERVRLAHEARDSFEIVESGPIQVADRWLWRAVIRVNGTQYIGTAEVKLTAPKSLPDGTNPFECAETSAVGRALGFAGLGSVDSIASADEVCRAIVEQEPPRQLRKPEPPPDAKLLPGQFNALKSLYLRLNQEIPADLGEWTFEQARATIIGLQSQLKQAS